MIREHILRAIRTGIRGLTVLDAVGLSVGEFSHLHNLRRLGIHPSRFLLYRKKWLRGLTIRTVIDVGANVGEFTFVFHDLFPDAIIYAFEPIPECYAVLSQVGQRYQRNRIRAYNLALGAEQGLFSFYRSTWTPASSFRVMSNLHKENYPHSVGSEKITVQVDTLDNVFKNINLRENVFIKMDVQGFEDEVIKGGLEVVKRAKVLVIECSLQSTYEGEPMFDGIYQLLRPMGFEYRGALKQSVRKDDQSFLQADSIFIRKD